jgi:hypothetical protein
MAFSKNFEYNHQILYPGATVSPFWRDRWHLHLVFVLEHEKNKISKNHFAQMNRARDIQVGIFEPWDWVSRHLRYGVGRNLMIHNPELLLKNSS